MGNRSHEQMPHIVQQSRCDGGFVGTICQRHLGTLEPVHELGDRFVVELLGHRAFVAGHERRSSSARASSATGRPRKSSFTLIRTRSPSKVPSARPNSATLSA